MSGFPVLDVATIAFGVPWAIEEQVRLLAAHLEDAYLLTVFDNSSDPECASELEQLCLETTTRYVRVDPPGSWHEHALNVAARDLDARGLPYCAFLDHDVFPQRPTRLVPLIDAGGFFGLPQRHHASGRRYLWPGLACFSRAWLGGRTLDFRGIRGAVPEENGDTGSMLNTLFDESDWELMPGVDHAYRPLRELDDAGVQSWAVELIGDWVHALNASGWKDVPDPEGRTRLVRELVAAL